MEWFQFVLTVGKVIKVILSLLKEKMVLRLFKPSASALTPKERLDYADELRNEFKKRGSESDDFNPQRFEMLGELAFGVFIPGHILAEIMDRSPSPTKDVQACAMADSLLETRLIEGKLKLKYPSASNFMENLTILFFMFISVTLLFAGIYLAIKKDHQWLVGGMVVAAGLIPFAIALSLARTQQATHASQRLIRDLFPPTPEEVAEVEAAENLDFRLFGSFLITLLLLVVTLWLSFIKWRWFGILGGLGAMTVVSSLWHYLLRDSRIGRSIRAFRDAWDARPTRASLKAMEPEEG